MQSYINTEKYGEYSPKMYFLNNRKELDSESNSFGMYVYCPMQLNYDEMDEIYDLFYNFHKHNKKTINSVSKNIPIKEFKKFVESTTLSHKDLFDNHRINSIIYKNNNFEIYGNRIKNYEFVPQLKRIVEYKYLQYIKNIVKEHENDLELLQKMLNDSTSIFSSETVSNTIPPELEKVKTYIIKDGIVIDMNLYQIFARFTYDPPNPFIKTRKEVTISQF
jgi:hypothetical protein